jgi:hypothetical protein
MCFLTVEHTQRACRHYIDLNHPGIEFHDSLDCITQPRSSPYSPTGISHPKTSRAATHLPAYRSFYLTRNSVSSSNIHTKSNHNPLNTVHSLSPNPSRALFCPISRDTLFIHIYRLIPATSTRAARLILITKTFTSNTHPSSRSWSGRCMEGVGLNRKRENRGIADTEEGSAKAEKELGAWKSKSRPRE